MHWNQISFEANKLEADLASEVLIGLGSISITYSDAHDDAIYEPPIGETPLWEFTRITALFKPEVSTKQIIDSLGKICNSSKFPKRCLTDWRLINSIIMSIRISN